jgi:hypothetical protein
MRINVPGRVIEFSRGGEAWLAYQREPRGDSREGEYDAGEWEFFRACEGPRRYAKGGYWVSVELSAEGRAAARYWAETLATAAEGDAQSGDQDARSDLRAARRLLERLHKATEETT